MAHNYKIGRQSSNARSFFTEGDVYVSRQLTRDCIRGPSRGAVRGARSRGRARRTSTEASNQPCVTVGDMITNVYKADDIRIYVEKDERPLVENITQRASHSVAYTKRSSVHRFQIDSLLGSTQ